MIKESLVLISIAIELEPNHPQIVQLSSTAKFSVTSQLGGEEEKEEKEQQNERGRPGTPERADRRQAQEKPAAGGERSKSPLGKAMAVVCPSLEQGGSHHDPKAS